MAKQRSNNPLMLARHLTQKSVALILAGGRGSHLKELTKTRTKPAVHFGGKFRLVDFTLSNCINSGIRRIGIITQYHSHTLTQHVRRTWSFINTSMNGFVDLLPAQQRCTSEDWYKGTANAVFQNVDIIRAYNAEFVVILAGDHIYKMDYSRMLIDHVESGAECTVACIPVPRREASKFGVMKVDHDNNILKFLDKPKNPPAMPAREDMSLASMGVYVFNANYLYQLLEEDGNLADSLHDFSNDIIPKITTQGKARAHSFTLSCIPDNDNGEPYWCDVRTLDNYWRANLDLASANPRLNIYDKRWPIRTYTESLPPAKLVQDCSGNSGIALNSLISDGCVLSGSTVVHSVLSPRVRVSSFCTIDSSVLLPDVKIGRSCRLRRCIIDRACVLPEAMVIGENEEEDSRRFYRSKDGIVLVTREMLARCKEV